jgi:hypothetical protein
MQTIFMTFYVRFNLNMTILEVSVASARAVNWLYFGGWFPFCNGNAVVINLIL